MSGENRKRLAEAVVTRRVDLGMLTTVALAEAAGLTARMLGDVENGRRQNFSRGAKAQIERALRWAPGSIDAVLGGSDPTPDSGNVTVTPTPARVVLLSQVPTFDLLDELRNRVVTDQTKPWPEVTTFTDRVKAMGNHDGLDQADRGHQ